MSLKDEQYKLSNIISNDIEVYGQHYKITYFKQCSTGKIVYKYALRTVRLLIVLGGGGLHTGGIYPTPGVCIWGVCIQGGLPNPGGLHPGGDLHPGGGSAQPGGSASREVGQIPLPMNRMTHRCKNITLPKLRLQAATRPFVAKIIMVGIFFTWSVIVP